MCKCMKVSTNAYYHWLKKGKYVREKESITILKEKIKIHYNNSKQIYGSYKITEALNREGLCYSRSYVARLMKKMGLASIVKK